MVSRKPHLFPAGGGGCLGGAVAAAAGAGGRGAAAAAADQAVDSADQSSTACQCTTSQSRRLRLCPDGMQTPSHKRTLVDTPPALQHSSPSTPCNRSSLAEVRAVALLAECAMLRHHCLQQPGCAVGRAHLHSSRAGHWRHRLATLAGEALSRL